MLWTIVGVLLVLWILGFMFEIAGGLIHILLVVGVILVIWNLIKGKAAGRG
ncbi:lmo0937 family membrane protein [Mesobacillus harenae]|uniref:lmo0937 family membrane protein n=1 Tax=Mesobacillus harenae TaxID=2213203 RepID=UPI001580E0B3|nr:lmo0937 family membrane protein [Mesobacillus harenae]